ncbi:hypothetical protein An02g01170 [Aspergillus niger]|uniref:Uncharacterized protein n=2 Tax=Aspergillus niger TaxID=5061 RepID=A2QBT6_ASPNC|nr:hypothetical protein An02g01170 [Aspergillus niger]CAK96333.1 hypothetical protein An02g01170 [Aspergillus niger]
MARGQEKAPWQSTKCTFSNKILMGGYPRYLIDLGRVSRNFIQVAMVVVVMQRSRA